MIAVLAAATLMMTADWQPPRPPTPTPAPPTALERAFAPAVMTEDAVVHLFCNLSIQDPHDGYTSCLSWGIGLGIGSAGSYEILQQVEDAEAKTKPGGCVIGVIAHSDKSVLCAAFKEPQ